MASIAEYMERRVVQEEWTNRQKQIMQTMESGWRALGKQI